ncbi:MAG: PPC domain-containing protein [Thermoanaerobaculia bacterium]
MKTMHTRTLSFTLSILIFAISTPAIADGTITNGATHTGVIEIGGLDTWTFTATKNDSITVSIGEVRGSGQDPYFNPWIRLRGPDGSDLGSQGGTAGDWGFNAAQIDVQAPLTGPYTLLVAHYPYHTQFGPSTYLLTVVKSPGPYSISAGDEGGPMSPGVPHAGMIPVGDLDAWTFQATANASLTISIGEVSVGGPDPYFNPWIRLRGPDGSDLGTQGGTTGDWGFNAAAIDVRAPLTGTYTLLVAHYPYHTQQGTAHYTVTGTGFSSAHSIAAILAVVGSAQGAGAFFRTRLQMHNPGSSPISGKLVFHRQGSPGHANDPSLNYSLPAGQTIDYPDVLPAMGISDGLGSLDIMTSGDPIPVIAARIFSDAGPNGTAGFFLEPLLPEKALRAGESGVLIAPPDPVQARLNLGIRSLDTGASFTVTVRDKNGLVRNTTTKTYPPHFFEQVSANQYLGVTPGGSDTITFTMTSGDAIIYGAQTDNKTQDPSAQYATAR